jgi:guanyl-specific ribonuclease Sa
MSSRSDATLRGLALAIGLALAFASGTARAQSERRPEVRVPAKVEPVLRTIDETGRAPAGHVGGGEYHNSGRRGEQLLPKVDRDGDAIAYRTWDVNPSGSGRSRGAERLVTGSDGSAYYSPDDYATFVAVRNPARSTHAGADHAREPSPPEPRKQDRTTGLPIVKLDPRTAARVDAVVDYIVAHDAPPPEHVGGRDFRNLGLDGGMVLPRSDDRGRPIRYREWDVNRRVPGRNRGAERIVTGGDGRVYYTRDHYATFQRIR